MDQKGPDKSEHILCRLLQGTSFACAGGGIAPALKERDE